MTPEDRYHFEPLLLSVESAIARGESVGQYHHSEVLRLLRAALPVATAGPGPELSCLGCGQVREPSTWDAQSHAYLCVECVHSIRFRPAMLELAGAALEFNEQLGNWQAAGRVSFAKMDPNHESERFFKAVDPFRYCFPVPESYQGPFADGVTPCADRPLAAAAFRGAAAQADGGEPGLERRRRAEQAVIEAARELNMTMPDFGDGDPLSDLDDALGELDAILAQILAARLTDPNP